VCSSFVVGAFFSLSAAYGLVSAGGVLTPLV
jgi:hypothetical protein